VVPCFHRTLPVPTALQRARAAAADLRCRLDISYEVRGQFPVTRAILRARDGGALAEGLGKGRGRQAEASAAFEALERRWCRGAVQRGGGVVGEMRLLPAACVAAQPALHDDGLLRHLARRYSTTPVGCARYSPVGGGGSDIWVPLFLSDPWYRRGPLPGDELAYWRFLRYGTSSGNAAGTSQTEAVLHGLLEVVERDSVSTLLIRRYLRGRETLPVVTAASLPAAVRTLKERLVSETGGPVHVIDLTTDLGVPTFAALAASARYPARLLGSGASLDASYAIERAVAELHQLVTLYHWGASDIEDERFGQRLRAWPPLWRAYVTALDESDGGGPVPLVPVSVVTGALPATPAGALAVLVDRLRAAELTVYARSLAPPSHPVAVANVYVPGAERFYLVRHGLEVVPTGRANAVSVCA
jgi:ribosomal protein S12 methylthiotransferase accessory factor